MYVCFWADMGEYKMERVQNADQVVRILKAYVSNMGFVGDTDFFGDKITEEDVIRSIYQLAKNAENYAKQLGKKPFLL